MSAVIDIVSWVCIVGGAFFAIVGGIGILRLPDFYTRMHAAGLTDTMGAILIFVGLMFQAGIGLVTLKLVMILFFLLVTSPTSAHALASSALTAGIEPQLGEHEEETPSAR